MFQLKKLIKITVLIYFFISAVILVTKVYSQRSIFQERYNYKEYKRRFDQSQWIVTNKNKNIAVLSDADLYSFVASELLQQKDPTVINFETPPLGKYLIAASIMIFDNQRVVSLFFGTACLVLIYYLTFIITRSSTASLLSTSLTMTSWLFIDQLINSPQMDIFQLFFLLTMVIFFTLFEKKKQIKYLVIASIASGAFASMKAFFIYLCFVIVWIGLYCFFKRKPLKMVIKNLIFIFFIASGVYFFYYLNYFLYNHGTVVNLIKVQKWIIGFYTVNSPIETARLIGSYLPLIYLNKWKFWSEGYPTIRYENWSILWPVFHFLGWTSIAYLWFKNKIKGNTSLELLISFIVAYSIFLFFTPVWPRYLLLLFVPMYIVVSNFLLLFLEHIDANFNLKG